MLEAQVMSYADALRGYLSHLRKENKVSQPVLAEAMGIARNTYIAWETGETNVDGRLVSMNVITFGPTSAVVTFSISPAP